jgi:protein-S-isoprenylcysteine O-methyltransferase Ste14
MSLVPAFELGLWNAWIFMVIDLLTLPILSRIIKRRLKKPPKDILAPLSKSKKIFLYSTKLVYIPAFIYSFFLPLKIGTLWFYLGFPVILIGLVTSIIVIVNWANTPPGEPITRGLYRYSRHPMYVTGFIFLLGISITTASWLFLLFGLIFLAGCAVFIDFEEQLTLEEYGDAYKEYLKRTPRWIGIPKSRE